MSIITEVKVTLSREEVEALREIIELAKDIKENGNYYAPAASNKTLSGLKRKLSDKALFLSSIILK